MTRGFALLLATGLAALTVAGGCRRDPDLDAYLNVLYSQQRALEDRLNDLSHEHALAVDELAAAEAKNEELLRELGRDGDDRPAPARRERPARPNDLPEPDSDPDSPPTLTPPMIEEGEEYTPTSGRKRRVRVEPANTSAERGPGLNAASQNRGQPADTQVTHIVLNPYLTQGHDFDGEPGDDGVSVAIEPRNGGDAYVAAPGKVSIVVIDPEAGEQGRIARWDFEAEEIARRLQSSGGQQGIELKLKWPKAPPTRASLRLFARYTNEAGERFEADRPIFLNLPGQFSHRWTPKSSRPVQDLLPDRSEALVERAPPRSARAPAEPPVERQAKLPEFKTPAPPPAAAPQPTAPAPLTRPQWRPVR